MYFQEPQHAEEPAPASPKAEVGDEGGEPTFEEQEEGTMAKAEVKREKAKAEVDRQNGGGASALYGACQSGHLECVQLLLEAKAGEADRPHRRGDDPPVHDVSERTEGTGGERRRTGE